MAWTNPTTYVDGNLPTDTDLNLYIRDDLVFGKGTGLTFTERDCRVMAESFEHQDAVAELRSTYTSTGSSFVLTGRDVSAAPSASGQKIRLTFAVGERDGGTEEKLGRIECQRPDTGDGLLVLDTYFTSPLGTPPQEHSPPALQLDKSGNVAINKATASYRVDVGGQVRAAGFRQSGSSIGKWQKEGSLFKYTGSVETSGQFLPGADGGTALDVASTTKCDNLNAAKLLGYGWTPAKLSAANTAGVQLPPLSSAFDYTTICSLSAAPRAGWYLIWAELTYQANNEDQIGGPVYGWTPNRWGWGTDTSGIPCAPGAAGATPQAILIARYRAALNEVMSLRAINNSNGTVTARGSIYAVWRSADVEVAASGYDIEIDWGTPVLA